MRRTGDDADSASEKRGLDERDGLHGKRERVCGEGQEKAR